ncbi:MAG: histidine--tRNA ligase [Verrucomicrobiota bacterium JB022]|nr:histidine--tRNA ligase [Verrucomicrobiota bacterium JB022]
MFQPLPGFRDFFPDRCAKRNHIFRLWTQTARSFNYQQYDIPTLEPLELFTQKSGEEIVGQLFNFTDKGGREVALRPELTPSLARMVGSQANSLKRPIKWFNIAENFRYEKQQKGRLRSHYQLNCDIFGEPGAGADAEVIATAVGCLAVFGLGPNDFVVRLSDRNLWLHFLASQGKTGDDAMGVLGVVDKMERMEEKEAVEKLTAFFGGEAAAFLARARQLIACRSLEDLQAFFGGLALEGELADTVAARLAEWKNLLSWLESLEVGDVLRVDLGIVRGLAYYTGFVFEVFEKGAEGELTGRALCGGGRYDHLVKKLGYTDLPAVGFGMGDVTITDLLESKGLLPDYITAPDLFLVVGNGELERKQALHDAHRLRSVGYSVEYPLKDVGFGKQFKSAAQSGARFALIYGEDEVKQRQVKVRNLQSGQEMALMSVYLIDALGQFFAEGMPEEHGHGHEHPHTH